KIFNPNNEGLGIDLGIKEFAVCSDGIKFKNINKTSTVKKVEKKLKREQRKLSRKYESLKIRNKNIKEGRSTRQNIQKQVVKVQKLHQRLRNIRTDYINKIVSSIIKQKPSYITIEDLAVSNLIKNKHLSKAIASQKFFEFKTKLMFKCKENNMELRIVNRFYPSSKTCSNCGNVKKDLKLSDRIYKCDCGFTIDRDLNASINLKNAK
ncbi:TPA: IS200/IS605 family element transposase accessory protein TnpB, partial [Clostridium perfringens]|nr:IS200/IS605 family element transposase accessory protein TnpB [Clostridium perfringens]